MIKYVKKDITTVSKGIVAHGCNCQGVMGAGVALAIRKKWPKAFESYVSMCQATADRSMLLGTALIVNVHASKPHHLFVANMFTQEYYGSGGQQYASPGAIATSLHAAVSFASAVGLPVYMPRIGCGLGGLAWERDVQPVVEAVLTEYPDVEIYICDL
jgi:O-acetyl-ADP-ribose deacetylase (regulator of RNase III)